jgi:thiamine biosynthesis protein ThiS
MAGWWGVFAMKLTVNGKSREVDGPRTVLDFLVANEVNPQLVAVEHNGVILKRERYAEAVLSEGDVLEIVHMVGGGA